MTDTAPQTRHHAERLDDRALDLLFRNARSYNRYTDRPVSEATLRDVWELARLGPTSANSSPARIVWCCSAQAKADLAAMASSGNARKILAAPVTAIIGMDLEFCDKLPMLFPHADARPWFSGNDRTIEMHALRNSSLQGAYLMLAARALGLDAGPMGGFDAKAVEARFFPGGTVRANFICTLGYGDPTGLHPRLPRLSFDEATRLA
ncbi:MULTISPECIES: malonic semialdehyde reductase [unclassified Paracoccus (in: a-proteobacteria)]|uniref:malonic semialdehyde reductase n=1 Tax=unclassified Paracoccus (in: a-proteobacteria) TaxID=2688777 RepID=UPI0012B42EC2|nr:MULTISPECIES: malonic semialdehyde reductase [unclassified Paracoccus (in: a-proteobacteria)]UXU73956.1 malonic semialdehyde reductase [Paracoccus sp. SMMA_5]UXU79843.1 malonic semialdehyde reductase [Paracoccus sp. SMMA_5_TC]